MSGFAPIAIVGQGCVLPGSQTPEALWQTVVSCRVQIGATPAARWRVDPKQVVRAKPGVYEPDCSWTDAAGFVTGFEEIFQAEGHRVPAELLRALDPVVQWSLHAAQAALRLARAAEKEVARAGLILGNLSYPTAGFHRVIEDAMLESLLPGRDRRTHPLNRYMSGLPVMLVARALGLGGEAFALDAACASSLYALKAACDRLQAGTADLMLAGGVNAVDPITTNVGFCALQAMSHSGRSRPFHAAADGLVPAEGAVVLALRRLDDAQARGDNILGVIRGIGLSNDGRSGGLLAPAAAGQVLALRRAYAAAGLAPELVSYMECHATGTPVGDAVELRAMHEIFPHRDRLTLGSLKANLGHLITAAGGAGLLKVLGAFREGVLPPHPAVDATLPALAEAGFRLSGPESAEWRPVDGRWIAGINAFGFGGNNAHLIVEKFTAEPARKKARRPRKAEAIAAAAGPRFAITALGVKTQGTRTVDEFAAHLLHGEGQIGLLPKADKISLAADEIVFPPKDLRDSLGQHLMVLAAAQDALRGLALPPDRTACFIGMGTDPEAGRHGLRWRLSALLEEHGISAEAPELAAAKDAVCAPLSAGHIIGIMPNMPANRISNQFNLRAAAHTVSREELSGDVALAFGLESLARGESDIAVVGAVDLSREPLHMELAAQVTGEDPAPAGDAAVVMVVKRLADAEAAGDRILGVINTAEPEETAAATLTIENRPGRRWLTPWFGHAHAAAGLMHLAAAAVFTSRRGWRVSPERRVQPLLPNGDAPAFRVINESGFGGVSAWEVRVAQPARPPDFAPVLGRPELHGFAAADRAGLARALEENISGGDGPCRLAFACAPGTAEIRRRAVLAALRAGQWRAGRVLDGAVWREQPVAGEVAFVFTGAAASYPAAQRELALAWPELVAATARLTPRAGHWCAPIFGGDLEQARTPFAQLCGSAYSCQLHAVFSREVLGLQPAAVLGLSSGETNSLYAIGAWADLEAMLDEIVASGLYEVECGGRFESARKHWGLPEGTPVEWENWVVLAPAAQVRAALAGETSAYLAIINSPGDCVIGGEREACRRVLAKLDGVRTAPLQHDLIVHCEALTPFAPTWKRIHTRPVTPVPGVRFYSNYFGGVYEPGAERSGESLTGQALVTVDFTNTVQKAWDDGARIFIEHGPRNALSLAIAATLGDRPHLAVSLDAPGRASHEQPVLAAAELWCAGVPVRLAAFAPQPALAATAAGKPAPALEFALRLPPLQIATLLGSSHSSPIVAPVSSPRTLPRPPRLAPVLGSNRLREKPIPAAVLAHAVREENHSPVLAPPVSAQLHLWQTAQEQIRMAHEHYLAAQSTAHQAYLETFSKMQQLLIARRGAAGDSRLQSWPMEPLPAPAPTPAVPVEVLAAVAASKPAAAVLPTARSKIPPYRPPSGLKLTRAQLEVHAQGKISEIFGPLFTGQDEYRIQVRMPVGELLLADRVTGMVGEPGGMGLGTVWTETDVKAEAWYMHHGRMGFGPFIETAQADMLLISWLGVDAHNRGERAYRLLGCEAELFGPIPQAGDVLCCDIHVERHTVQGQVRLFTFRNQCRINGEVRMEVQGGIAGFFTAEELANSEGVKWNPATAPYVQPGRLAPVGPHATKRTTLTPAQVIAYTQGDLVSAFGESHRLTQTHTRTPRSAGGRANLIGEITHLDYRGGPAGRGYIRSVMPLTGQEWFFPIHFHNDPCMPGTLMVEGATQLLALYLVSLGCTLDKDGWRFEPVHHQKYKLVCRGQAIPESREIVYELFVDEIILEPRPTIFAHILGSVDGRAAFLCERFGLQLVPDFPLLEQKARLVQEPDSRPVALLDGHPCDRVSLLHSCLGLPSGAFGPRFLPYDDKPRALARLPGPPLLMITRVLAVSGPAGLMRTGTKAVMAWDTRPDHWYFQDNGRPVMPFGVFMELMLQPCGWLATHQLNERFAGAGLTVRNLDGTLTLHRDITPADREIVTETELTGLAEVSGLLLVKFRGRARVGNEEVAVIDTGFGFFPPEALLAQKGLKIAPEEVAQKEQPGNLALDLTTQPAAYFTASTARLPTGRWRMLDRITGWWPQGGKAGRGYLRAERDIVASDWVFKAHFFQDPVQPGSVGIESLMQMLQFHLLHQNRQAGLRSPGFEAVASGEETEWHYRGQITPASDCIVLDIEITDEGVDERGPWVRAEGCLWLGTMKIYHAPKLAMRLVEAPAEESAKPAGRSPATVALPLNPNASGPLDWRPAEQHWRQWTRTGPSFVADSAAALAAMFVRRVVVADPADFAALRGRPAIYVGNHQVGVETCLFLWLVGALTETPFHALAKQELAATWAGFYEEAGRLTFGARSPLGTLFFDRQNRMHLPQLLQGVADRWNEDPRSLMVHAEGTRASRAGEKVTRLSSVFVDFACKHGVPIVPVWFAGGLPVTADGRRREYPVGGGRQDFHIGSAIQPDVLTALPYAKRSRRIVEAINALCPGDDAPFEARPEFAAEIDALVTDRGLNEFAAMTLAALRAHEDLSEESKRLLAMLADPIGNPLAVDDKLAAEVRRFFGGSK